MKGDSEQAEPRSLDQGSRPERPSTPHAGTERGDRLGNALRSVYDRTLTENIPESMLDLLRKMN